jgi:hypothetical protein
MAEIYNSDLTKELIEGAKIQLMKDRVPTQLADKVVPVMEVNPKMLRKTEFVKNGLLSDSLSSLVFTTSSTTKTMITSFIFSYRKDAVATALLFNLTAVINGVTTNIATLRGTAATAESDNIALNFPPLEIDPGTNVNITSDSADAAIRLSCCIYGYEILNPNA